MKDKISKIKNLIKKYGLAGTLKKMVRYIYANYLVKVSVMERIYILLHKKVIQKEIKKLLANNHYNRIVVWRSAFGWNVPLYQRPQHIFSNFAKQKTLVFYEVTRFTDDVKRIKKQANNLYLLNFVNKAFADLVLCEIEKMDIPRYVQFYSTDWQITKMELESYKLRGYKIIYEYIDDLNPSLAGTDELPVNVKEKYDMVMKDQDVVVVVTADALQQDVISKRGSSHLVFSGNGVDYSHFHNNIDFNYKFDTEYLSILNKKKPIIGYYGALAKWFDYELVKKIGQTGCYEVVLLGIKYDDAYEQSGLDALENVHFLGSRDYSVLQNYASKMDLLMIPFLINDITKATSPVKLFEYMALNKPIVTTDMDECRKYQSVLIGHSHEEFLEKIEEALCKADEKEYQALLNKEALENTWTAKASVILEELERIEHQVKA